MDDSVIKRHNFEIELNKIQTFSNKLPSNPSFSKFEVNGGLFNWGDHKVTGQEMNCFVEKIQKRMISINDSLKSMIVAFRDVYKAFDYLDREYINGIRISVEGAEKASQQALSAHEGNKKTIQTLQRTVQTLNEFKETVALDFEILTKDLNNLKSEFTRIRISQQDIEESCDYIQTISNEIKQSNLINKIDEIWDDVQKQQNNIDALRHTYNSKLEELKNEIIKTEDNVKCLHNFYNHLISYVHLNDIDVMWTDLQSNSSNIVVLNNFVSRLKSSKYLFDIDTIWNNLQEQRKELKRLNDNFNISFTKLNEITTHINKDVEILKEYQQQLKSYAHLSDIDDLWNNVEKHSEEVVKLQKQNKEITQTVNVNDKNLRDIIDAMKEKYALDKVKNEKRIKIAYYIAGVSVVLTIGSFVLQLTGLL